MKQLITITTISLALVMGITAANALTISPPLMEIDAKPGEVINETIKVIGETEDAGLFYPSIANFIAQGEEGNPAFLEDEETKYSLASWIEIDSTAFALEKHERRVVPFTIRVPKNASPGGHYGVIFFSTQQPPVAGEQRTALGVTGKLGSLILVRVAGDIKEEGRIVEFDTVDKKKFYNRLPIDFITRFENTGNVHLKPQGEIKIENFFGKQTEKLSINEERRNVLPESIRKFSAAWEKEETAPAKKADFLAELEKEKKNFALGRYKAILTLGEYGESVKNIWIIPWRLLSVCLVGLVLILLMSWKLIGKYNRWIAKRYQAKK